MKALGIVLAGGNSNRMQQLSDKRAIAAMPVIGSYRAIDFALSSMTNSHIQRVAVLTQYNSRSLNEHLSSSKWWDFGRKQGGLFVFTPTITNDNSFWYRGTADSIYQNINFLKQCHEPYVVICSGDGIYKMDFNKVLQYHVDQKADITVVTVRANEKTDMTRFGVVETDGSNRITDFVEKPLQAPAEAAHLISTGIYVIRRRQLIELVEKAAEEDRYDFVQDILIRYKDVKKIVSYEHTEYWRNIASVEDYFSTNMDFLNREIRDYFFRTYPDIYSKIDDLPPAKYNAGAVVKNSLVSSGSIINGRVENSILFKQVYVGNNVTIINSIIMNDVHIGDGAYIENCIVESRDTIRANERLVGENGQIRIVVEKNERYII